MCLGSDPKSKISQVVFKKLIWVGVISKILNTAGVIEKWVGGQIPN